MRWIHSLSWTIVILMVVTLGLAPYKPEPHILEKLTMLFNGELAKPIDIFDLFLHGMPWLLLILKTYTLLGKQSQE